MAQATFRIWRTQPGGGGAFQDYRTEVSEGMVVLDAVHRVQAEQAPDMAVRWNCKAGKCGSCSAEINGRPRLMCMAGPILSRIDGGRSLGELQGLLAVEFGARAAPAAFDADFAQLYRVVNGIGHMLIRRQVG